MYTQDYDSLDRSRSLEILKGYGVGERVRRMLREYWECTAMVARAGSYYGKGFKGGRVVTQGDPLSPTIFNMVVDAVVRHWLTITAQEAERRGERGREGRHQAVLFYADDGMLALSDPRCAARSARHAYRFVSVGVQPHPVEDSHELHESPLQSPGVGPCTFAALPLLPLLWPRLSMPISSPLPCRVASCSGSQTTPPPSPFHSPRMSLFPSFSPWSSVRPLS